MKNSEILEVVALALKNCQTNEFMLARRGPGNSGAGEWEFPGGKVESGETQRQALVREIYEELMFNLGEADLTIVADHIHQYPQRKIQIFLWSSVVTEKPQFQLSEHDQVGWFTIDQIKELNLTEGDKHFISLLNSIK